MPAIIPSGREHFLAIGYPDRETGAGSLIPVRSNSAPADQARIAVTGPATARRGQQFTIVFDATLPGNASGAFYCTLLFSRTQPFSPNDSAVTFRQTIQAGGGAYSLGPLTTSATFVPGNYFLGITCRDDVGSSPAPTGFPFQVTN